MSLNLNVRIVFDTSKKVKIRTATTGQFIYIPDSEEHADKIFRVEGENYVGRKIVCTNEEGETYLDLDTEVYLGIMVKDKINSDSSRNYDSSDSGTEDGVLLSSQPNLKVYSGTEIMFPIG